MYVPYPRNTPTSHTHRLTFGTTPSGLFMSLAFTRGSASAAQPRALGLNPLGVPGGIMACAVGNEVNEGSKTPHPLPQRHECARRNQHPPSWLRAFV